MARQRPGRWTGRWPGQRQTAAFRPAATPARATGPSRRQTLVLVLALIAVAGAVTVASFAVRPSKARAFDLFYGSVFVNDNTAPVAVDLATGKPSVRLTNAYTQVSAKASGDLDVVPLENATLLLDSATGEFNMLDSTGFVLKASGGGVSLPNAADSTSATGIAAGSAAYIVRSSPNGTSVYLVNQSTVSTAAGGAKAQARASISMPQQVTDVGATAVAADSSGGATANSDLWLLMGAGPVRTIRQLRVPSGSNAGATLTSRDHGTVQGIAAMGVATRDADGSGGDVVAVASQEGIDVFAGTSQVGHLDVHVPAGVDTILPASNQQGSFAFLYHSASGWSLVRARADATGAATVTPLPEITGTSLAPPAQSDGTIYTIDRHSGELWQIASSGSATPVPGASQYPVVPGETSFFGDASLLANGTRVIFNSRTSLEALTVFADGSHRPVVIDKRTAVDLNSNGAAALANLHMQQSTGPAKPNPSGTNKPKPNPAAPVTDRIDCKTTTQIPHIPSVQLVSKGSRSVQIQWTYPLLDRQDCAPSTYTVSTQVVGGDAPSPPGTVTVQGVTGVNLAGLFPDTQYKIVVNAYINGQHTPSAPLLVRTQIEGPAAPTNVKVDVDDQGNWLLSWNSCGGVQQGCVPVDSWTIVPQLCDSSGGLIGAPANGTLVGDPTTHTFSYTYRGGDDLLGYGLTFAVEGVGDQGTVGAPGTTTGCVHSWTHPNAAAIHVSASTPPHTVQGGTSSTNVNVTFDEDQNVALGGVGGTLTYRLLSAGSLVQQKGPTGDTAVAMSGVQPGQGYQVQVIVAPPGHPTASVALPPVDVQAAVADWPTLGVTASFTPAPAPSATGQLTLSISGLSSADARGETFDLANTQLVCGNTAMPLSAANIDPARPLTFGRIDRSVYNGSCTVQLALQEDQSTIRSPAYFGGTTSPATSSPPVLIPVPDLDTSAGQFSASFVNSGTLDTPKIAVSYNGNNGLMASYAIHWSIQAQFSDGSSWNSCASPATGNPAQAPVTIDLSGASCYYSNYNQPWRVTIDFSYFGQSPSPPYSVAVSGSAPPPVDPGQMQFTAAWSGDSVLVSYSGPYSDSVLGRLNWTEQVTSNASPGTCGSSTQPPSNSGPISIAVDLGTCPATTGGSSSGSPAPTGPSGSAGPSSSPTPSTYTVDVTFTDPNYGTTHDYTVTVSGTPS